MTKRRKATDADAPELANGAREGVEGKQGERETAVEVPREAGTSNPVEAAQRFEVRKDGSIAYFSSESAAVEVSREVGS